MVGTEVKTQSFEMRRKIADRFLASDTLDMIKGSSLQWPQNGFILLVKITFSTEFRSVVNHVMNWSERNSKYTTSFSNSPY